MKNNKIIFSIIIAFILSVAILFLTYLLPVKFEEPILLEAPTCDSDMDGCWGKMMYAQGGYPLTFINFIVQGDYFGPPIEINFLNLLLDFFIYFLGVLIIIKIFQCLYKIIDDIL